MDGPNSGQEVTTSTFGCRVQLVEVFERTALRGVGTAGLRPKTFENDNKKNVNLTNCIVASDQTGEEMAG